MNGPLSIQGLDKAAANRASLVNKISKTSVNGGKRGETRSCC